MSGVLEGIRVLDFSRFIAGPYCGMLLADAGAEVIKVEKAGIGDDTRILGPWKDGISLYFPGYNRNKKSVTVNFRNEQGIELLKKLIKNSDVLVENFRAGTMDKMGLGYDIIKQINPRIIMASVSGFGQSGPYKLRPAFDNIVSAMAGVSRIREKDVVTSKGAINDIMAAMYAAYGVTLALLDRERTGEGQYIDVSMFASSCMVRTVGIAEEAMGADPETQDKDDCAPYGLAKAKDGWIAYHAGTDSMFNRMMKVCDEPLFREEKYQDVEVRVQDEQLLKDTFEHWTMQHSADEIERLLCSVEVPVGIVNTPKRLLQDHHLNATGHIVEVPVHGLGNVPYFAFPIKMSNHMDIEYRAAPKLGENNQEIYGDLLGMPQDELNAYKEKGII